MKKYELIREGKLFRIIALKDFGFIKKGELGGLIEKESNLSQKNECWVYKNAEVTGNALVYGNAEVTGNALVHENAEVSGNALVYGKASVSGNALVYGNAEVTGNARVGANASVSGKCFSFRYIISKGDYIESLNYNNLLKLLLLNLNLIYDKMNKTDLKNFSFYKSNEKD